MASYKSRAGICRTVGFSSVREACPVFVNLASILGGGRLQAERRWARNFLAAWQGEAVAFSHPFHDSISIQSNITFPTAALTMD